MVRISRHRRGSLAFYPRKKAARETPAFRAFVRPAQKEGEPAHPLNFLAYKVGMTHVIGRDAHEKGISFGQEVSAPVTILEAPPLRVFGARAYAKTEAGRYGTVPLGDVFAQGADKHLLRRIRDFKQKKGKKGKGAGKEEQGGKAVAAKDGAEKSKADLGKIKHVEKSFHSVDDFAKEKEKITEVRLLCHSQPHLTGIGKKKPAVGEVSLSGGVQQQLQFAKEHLGKELKVADFIAGRHFVDVKAVSKGKGMQGPVKRFGVKTLRRKAKKERMVGSIGPWHPPTVMWTVARSGQMGYHSRTEYNKRVLKVGSAGDTASVNPAGGFKNYGLILNDFLIVAGSIVGPSKRAIALRMPARHTPFERHKLEAIDYIATSSAKPVLLGEEDVKAQKILVREDKKEDKKSVADEISAAVKGEEHREKKKEG
ncbi:MAG: 50S ribosomal protein L3 [Candidatus Diapherotrites archaeon]|nr:50S ribosomal protein L3 [Candidatus Diapherotrites archaeon]